MYNNNHAVYLHNSLNIKFNLNIINISMLLQGVFKYFIDCLSHPDFTLKKKTRSHVKYSILT